jgi:hypothetical protein
VFTVEANKSILMHQAPHQQPTPQEQWLSVAHPSEWHFAITKKPGGEWVSLPKPYRREAICNLTSSERNIAGIRPEGSVRSITCDFDHKEDYSSKYWHKFARSKELIQLEQEANKAGCSVSFIRSSESGGLHCYISLPEAAPCWLAHWIGMELFRRAGIEAQQGQAELFPSRMDFQQDLSLGRVQSQGFRLPGQHGSALIVNESYVEDCDLIYSQLNNDLEQAEDCYEWRKLIDAAKQLKKRTVWGAVGARKKANSFSSEDAGIKWTESGQSERLLLRITTLARIKNPHITCPVQLGEIIRDTALETEGFQEHASDKTKKDLMATHGGWGERLARCSLKKDFGNLKAVPAEKLGGDKHRNERLFKESRAKLKAVWRTCKKAAELSKRELAKAAKLSRRTLEKHWEYWVSLLAHTPLSNGVHPGRHQYRKAIAPSNRYNCKNFASKFDEAFVYLDEFDCFIENPLKRLLDSSILCSSPPHPLLSTA